jgi:hypothetical protein
MNDLPGKLANWIPWRLSGTLCTWMYLGNKKIIEPFFNDTISVCRNLNENRKPYKVVSDLDIMAEWAEDINAIAPSAVIFHVSRCGSTLLSQLLVLEEQNIMLSEVPFFDELLRLRYRDFAGIKTIDNYLSAAIKFYGQKRNEKENNLFIKTDSWHLHFYEQVRNLFPFTPFILLYRNPGEVILSHQKQRGMQSVPGMIEPKVFGFSTEQIKETNLDAYMINVLESYFIKMIEIAETDKNVLLFDYKEGMLNILKNITGALHLNITKETESLLNERIRFHAKHPQQLFAEHHKELSEKNSMASVFKLYEKLDAIRLNKLSTM